MAQKKKKNTVERIEKNKDSLNSEKCNDKLCPFHGEAHRRLKLRGRIFEGEVIKKLPGRVTIEFDRMVYMSKYERYEKRTAKLHARLPDCLNDVNVGDRIRIAETRPISRTMHFVVTKIVRKNE